MVIDEIELDENYVKVYFTEVSTPLAISRDAFYKWLDSNEMLHWAEDDFSLLRGQLSGEYSYDDYYSLPISEIQTDIAKYIKTLDL